MTNQELRLTNKAFFGYIPSRIRSKELEIIRKKCNLDYKLLSKIYFGLIIESERGCWINDDWTKYRFINYNGKTIGLHRLSFKIFRDSVQGKFICHYCDRKGCINPFHLFSGTRQDNITDYKLKQSKPILPTEVTHLSDGTIKVKIIGVIPYIPREKKSKK